VDYSQLELRVASMLCQDPKMLAIWQSGVDYHQRTAELISKVAWGIDPSQVTKEHRSKAKVPNFGVIYGMTSRGLAAKLGCSVREAEKIINAIKGEFVVFDRWCKDQVAQARKTGFVWTWWAGLPARRRPLFNVDSRAPGKRSNAENGAVNTPVQGTASDFCLASITELVPWIIKSKLPVELVLTVHDSIMFHARSDVLEEVAVNAQRIMTQWESAGVPLVADMKRGISWGSLVDYKLAV
jgi:DNA polymerase-1